MLSGSRLEKLHEWTRRLERFEDSELTVLGFCDAEGVSVPSYYYWRKKLRNGSRSKSSESFQPVELVPSHPLADLGVAQAVNPATTIWLGNDVRIELGRDEKIATLVVKQVVAMVATAPADLPGE